MAGMATFNLSSASSIYSRPSLSLSKASSLSFPSKPSILPMLGFPRTPSRSRFPSNAVFDCSFFKVQLKKKKKSSEFILWFALQRFMHFLVTISKWVPTLKQMALLGEFWVFSISYPFFILYYYLISFYGIYLFISKYYIVNYVFYAGLSLIQNLQLKLWDLTYFALLSIIMN